MTTNPEPTVVKLSNPPDIVAALPVFIGFHPAESVVLMCLHGPRRRSGLAMRVDLPDPQYHEFLATDLATRAARDHADGVILVCYTEDPDQGTELPRHDLIDLVLEKLRQREIGWQEVLLVRGGRWWSYLCAAECCPREGTPVPDRPSSEVAALEARSALEGRAILASRTELEASVRGPVAVRAAVLRAVQERAGRSFIEEVTADGADAALRRTLALARSAFGRYVAGEHGLTDTDATRLLVGLEDRLARDALLTWALDGNEQELIVFLSHLARCAVDEIAAPICTALAGVAYQCGEGALAGIALDRALASEPGYELARLLDAALRNQVDPAEISAMARRTREHLQRWGLDSDEQAAAA